MMLTSDAKHDANRVNFGEDAYLAKAAKPLSNKSPVNNN